MNKISEIENKLGYSLPKEYITFLQSNNQNKYIGKQYCRILSDGYKTEGKIEIFSSCTTFLKDNEYRNFLIEFQEHWNLSSDFVQSKYLYIIASCYNEVICLALKGIHKGKIYCVDNGDFGITLQSNSLNSFLESLYSNTDNKCEYKDLKKAVSDNNLLEFKKLMENNDGIKILSHSSFYNKDLNELIQKNKKNNFSDYLKTLNLE